MNLKNLFLAGGLATIIGVSSFNQPFMHAEAALTAPSSWTFKYTNQDFPGYKLRSQTAVISTPTYTRTADGVYYNYTSTFEVIDGLQVTQTFNRSNTIWYDETGGNYVPSDTKIGSNSTVGNISAKYNIIFENYSNHDYRLLLDLSSSGNGFGINMTSVYKNSVYSQSPYFTSATSFIPTQIIFAQSSLRITAFSTGNAQYFDAWYLQDLGVSPAYESGVDDGIIQGEQTADSTVLLDAVETVVGVAINFILMIMTFSIFDISLLNIALVLVAILGIVWILKALRG